MTRPRLATLLLGLWLALPVGGADQLRLQLVSHLPEWYQWSALGADHLALVQQGGSWQGAAVPIRWAAGSSGDGLRIAVPAGGVLRVSGKQVDRHFELWSSNGSGAYRRLHWRSVDAQSWQVTADDDSGSVIWLRAREKSDPIRLYIGRPGVPALPALYRDSLPLELDPVEIASEGDPPRKHGLLLADQVLRQRIEGPARIELRLRPALIPADALSRRTIQLRYGFDGASPQSMDIDVAAEVRRLFLVNGERSNIGRERRLQLNAPSGWHELQLQANGTLYLRGLMAREPDYLLPITNRGSAEQWLGQLNAGGELRLAQKEPEPFSSLLQRWQRSATRPDQREPLLATLADADSALQFRPPQVARLLLPAIARLRQRHGFYRSLWPEAPLDKPLQPVRYHPQRMLRPGERRRVVVDRYTATRGAQQLWLVPITGQRDVVYPLPERGERSRLQLVVDRSRLKGPTRLDLDIGQRRQELLLTPEPGLPAEQYQLEPEQVLDRQNSALCAPPGCSGLEADQSSRLIDAALLEFDLPAEVVQIRLRHQAATDLPIALRYLASRPYELTEALFQQQLANRGRASLLADFQRLLAGQSPARPADLLQYHYQPIARRIRLAAEQLLRGIRRVAAPLGEPAPSPAEAKRLLLRANQAEREDDRVLLVETLTRLARRDDDSGKRAFARLLPALSHAGNGDLATRLARAMLLADDPYRQRLASDWLLERARLEQNEFLLQGVLSWRAIHGQVSALAELTGLWLQGAEERAALTVGLLLPEAMQPTETLRIAALRIGWLDSLEALLTPLAPSERAVWQGHIAAARRQYAMALDAYRRGGEVGKVWASQLSRGLDLRRQLTSDDAQQRATGIKAWLSWFAEVPGPWRWRSAVVDGTAAASRLSRLYNRPLDRHVLRVRSSPGQPVSLFLPGPGLARVHVRAVGQQLQRLRNRAWFELAGERLPLFAGRSSNALESVASSDEAVGVARQWSIELADGWNRLQLGSDDTELLIDVERRSPLLPVLPLPEPSPWLARWLLANPLRLPADAPATPELHTHIRAPQRAIEATALVSLSGELPKLKLSAAQRRMLSILRAGDHSRIAEAAATHHAHADDPLIGLLWRQIQRHGTWARLEDADDGAGLRRVLEPASYLDSPLLRVHALFSAATQAGDILLTRGRGVLLLRDEPQPRRLTLQLKPVAPRFQRPGMLQVLIERDGQVWRRLRWSDGRSRQLPLDLRAGSQSIRIRLQNATLGQMLAVGLIEDRPEQDLPVRQYMIATADEPVVGHVDGPAWVRIDSREGDATHGEYRWFPKGWHRFEVRPGKGRDERMVRLFVYRPGPAVPQPLSEPEPAAPALPWARRQSVGPSPVARPVARMVGQDRWLASSWEWRGGLEHRASGSLEEGQRGQPDSFAELSLTRRYFDPWRIRWFENEALVRFRDSGGNTLGLRNTLHWRPDAHPFDLSLALDLYAQRAWGETLWHGLLSGSVSQRRELGPRTAHTPRLTLFGRAMAGDAAKTRGRIDRDLYSRYKADHPLGWRLSDTLVHRPWLDTQFYAAAAVTGNAGMIERPDQLTSRLGYRQRLGNVGAELSWRHSYFFDDDDRRSSSNGDRLRLSLDWERWRLASDRLASGLVMDLDPDSNELSARLQLSWSLTGGRGYRDWRPGTVDFRDLRERRRIDNWAAEQR